MADDGPSVIWQPNPKQAELIRCPVFEVFFGGARGGGKTDGMLAEFVSHADLYGEHAIGLMVRRQRTELIETIERSKQLYRPLSWVFHEQDKLWRAPNGARLRFAYLERDSDADAYQGHNYTRVYIEEAGTFPSYAPIAKLTATLRSGSGVPVGMRLTGNPGGPGHQWVKSRYIDPAPQGFSIIVDERSGLERVYIPSRVTDNPFLGPAYIQQLKAVGSENLVKAWLEGDWTVIDGAFFDCWSYERHVIKPFAIPDDWLRFRSCDWGSASPFSVGWWAVVSDDYRHDSRVLPRGALVRVREWYGASAPNVGIKLTAEEVAQGILEREHGEKISYGVIDPSAHAQDGGPSLAERMARLGVYMRAADNKRVTQKGALGGWDMMRHRLKGQPGGEPMLYVFETCKDFIRTVPALQHDRDKPEDLDTDAEDHVADEARYACMSRPWVPRIEPEKPKDEAWYIGKNGSIVGHIDIRAIAERKERQKRRDSD
jgi:hypothetical protein